MDEYTLTEQELNDLREIFFHEAGDILQALDHEILNLESGPKGSDSLKNIQRALHTLKGNSRALGFAAINTVAHKAEDLLKAIGDTEHDTDKKFLDLLFHVKDHLLTLVDAYQSNREAVVDEGLLQDITAILSSLKAEGKTAFCSSASVYDITVDISENGSGTRKAAATILERLGLLGEVIHVESSPVEGECERSGAFRVRLSSSESKAKLEEAVALPEQVRHVEVSLHRGNPVTNDDHQSGPATSTSRSHMVKIDAQRVDKILNLVGELVIGRSMIGQVLSEISDRDPNDVLVKKLSHANAFVEKTLSQLQKNVMKMRMHPISQIFRKFPRVVRDLSHAQHKQIELVMEGEKTELDKSILDVIGEPLIHLVRNAVDHGIELPAEREQAGKPAVGTITLRAAHDGNQIVIHVIDDGKGLDPRLLRQKAVEKRLKTAEEANRLSDIEAMDLIFLTGFTTASAVTDISGRGLGMDIVRSSIESLKGRIQVSSRQGEGTTFTLRLPLTLAIIRAMLFWIDNRLLALPLSSVEKIVKAKEQDVQTISAKKVLRYHDKVISLLSLEESLGSTICSELKKYVIVVRLNQKLYGFPADRLAGQQELVIKMLDNHWGTVQCTSGVSVLGNGQVVLILDPPAVIMKELGREVVRA